MASSKPTTLGELQLFKVLQRANLISYYEAFISQGGDDVQQLCEAGEEEFLEIMALVGMACKPLHVRRLQKSLQEWVTRPAIFRATNISYLPAQSISLTSLGIDTGDLSPSVLNTSMNSAYSRSTSSAPPAQDLDVLARMNGSLPKSPQRNSTSNDDSSFNKDSEKRDRTAIIRLVEIAVQKAITNLPTPNEKRDVLLELQRDEKHKNLVSALEGNDEAKLEAEVKRFVKAQRSSEGSALSRHEVLLTEAAVKLCMLDRRFLLTKSELWNAAEKVATEVEGNLSNRRRSSTHLHGSCSQTRLQEINARVGDIKGQRLNWQKKLSEAKASKNVLRENECQSRLTRIAREEVLLMQEKTELADKLQTEAHESCSKSPTAEKSFSAELADLAKAHNLSLGNFQSSNSSPWRSQELSSNHTPNNSNGERMEVLEHDGQRNLSDSPVYNSSLSPPQMDDLDLERLQGSSSQPPSLIRVKMEGDEEPSQGFPPRPNTAVVRGVKRRSMEDRAHLSAKVSNSIGQSSD